MTPDPFFDPEADTNQFIGPGTESVETAWAAALVDDLPIDHGDDPRSYTDFLFGNPAFTMTEIDPDSAVVLVDQLLDRYPPMAFFDVTGALTTEEWTDLKERLVVLLAEGVDGERPGPASAFPDGPEEASEYGVTAGQPQAGTQPAHTSASSMQAPTGRGFGPDLSGVDTPTELARAIEELVEEADLDPALARQALELVLDDLEDESDDE